MPQCAVPTCTAPRHAKGYCKPHYSRWKRHGDPLAGRRPDIDPTLSPGEAAVANAIWTPSGCLVSQTVQSKGYGTVAINGTRHLAHRVVYEHHHGPIPDGLVVRHSCDNPPCVNIRHLLLGTHSDNMRDMMMRARSTNAKLTDEQVREVRRLLATGHSLSQVATLYDVSKQSVWQLSRGYTYSHVT